MSRDSGDSLLDFVSSVAGEELLKVEENLGDGYVRLRVSEAERRQAKHDIRCVEDGVVELLRNSRDAGAHTVFLASWRNGPERWVCCIDDGEGIPAHLHEAIFEPRVTSKLDTMTVDDYGVHGRGMALYSLNTNMSRMRVVSSEPHLGTAMLAVADTSTLSERKDQSTWPEVDTAGDAPAVTKGPHNILRVIAEFALLVPSVDVYIGSAAEILATMRACANATHSMQYLFDQAAAHKLLLWHRAGTAVDPRRLALLATELYGLEISERNAQRVLLEEIPPLATVAQRLDAVAGEIVCEAPTVDLTKDRRSVRIGQDDLDVLADAVTNAFAAIAQKYYLHSDIEPRVSATSEEIRIRLPLHKEE